MADNSLFLKNLWYLAFHGSFLKKDKLVAKEILGERIVFGRDSAGQAFALRDNCPHRGVPLSGGWFKDDTLQCCYHGWEFNTDGVCKNIPAIAPGSTIDFSKIRVFRYPIKEVSDTVWVYIPEKRLHHTVEPKTSVPNLILDPTKKFLHVESVVLPANIDHSVIGLIDPAHVTFVHQSWYWRSAKKLKLKEKHFAPTPLGFKMVRHAPSNNSKGYTVLKGGTSTEITFEIPGNRYEHIQIGEKHEIISITTLTPLNENTTELNHIFYSTLPATRWFWWPLKRLGKKFIGQDLGVFMKLARGLESNPTLMLIGEPDAQAKWYHEIKRLWQKAQQDNVPFENPVKEQTLHWVT
ncbi:MAG: aromatic ring-hydroxylating dioxygenase subunit alpha [Cyclobacteriaceae bacterium]|nr:aromatic ring-hydroxylating dioxygenase subunit alpha [Cyclobacteriaceae bacterium]